MFTFLILPLCKVIRDLELLPPLLGQDWSSVFLQRFDGAVTYVAYTASFRVCADSEIVGYGLGHVFGYAVYFLGGNYAV